MTTFSLSSIRRIFLHPLLIIGLMGVYVLARPLSPKGGLSPCLAAPLPTSTRSDVIFPAVEKLYERSSALYPAVCSEFVRHFRDSRRAENMKRGRNTTSTSVGETRAPGGFRPKSVVEEDEWTEESARGTREEPDLNGPEGNSKPDHTFQKVSKSRRAMKGSLAKPIPPPDTLRLPGASQDAMRNPKLRNDYHFSLPKKQVEAIREKESIREKEGIQLPRLGISLDRTKETPRALRVAIKNHYDVPVTFLNYTAPLKGSQYDLILTLEYLPHRPLSLAPVFSNEVAVIQPPTEGSKHDFPPPATAFVELGPGETLSHDIVIPDIDPSASEAWSKWLDKETGLPLGVQFRLRGQWRGIWPMTKEDAIATVKEAPNEDWLDKYTEDFWSDTVVFLAQ
ncbi:hypothetical protein FALBO_9691 [Fusarium albosuccineum]|uniref:Uncharacterized protein n=1 Tax=Fusarium albosuccineum TaxID=1237068 RepID=A0A8H4PBR6_9HYPO|nr:hypothetical protein FALBO_9691 [Fusarium albosuccineum]